MLTEKQCELIDKSAARAAVTAVLKEVADAYVTAMCSEGISAKKQQAVLLRVKALLDSNSNTGLCGGADATSAEADGSQKGC